MFPRKIAYLKWSRSFSISPVPCLFRQFAFLAVLYPFSFYMQFQQTNAIIYFCLHQIPNWNCHFSQCNCAEGAWNWKDKNWCKSRLLFRHSLAIFITKRAAFVRRFNWKVDRHRVAGQYISCIAVQAIGNDEWPL